MAGVERVNKGDKPMTTHPEQKDTEIYLGNVAPADWPPSHIADFKTLRLGTVAYDLEGKKLSPAHGLVPLFIGKGETDQYDRIKTQEIYAIRGW